MASSYLTGQIVKYINRALNGNTTKNITIKKNILKKLLEMDTRAPRASQIGATIAVGAATFADFLKLTFTTGAITK